MRVNNYERKYWIHEEKMLCKRQTQNEMNGSPTIPSTGVPASSAQTPVNSVFRATHLDILPRIPEQEVDGSDDQYSGMSPSGVDECFFRIPNEPSTSSRTHSASCNHRALFSSAVCFNGHCIIHHL